ncbi:MAG: NADP-dependent oxidoreductase [Gemmatimonadota bacterium]
MRALRFDSFGPIAQVARFVDIPPPEPAAGEVLVRVACVSINPLDWKLAEGQFRRFAKSRPPAGIGSEFGGTVEAHGSGVSAPTTGSRVICLINPFARRPGALQEFVAIPARDALAVEDVDLATACTLPCAGLSALQMCRMARVAPGQRVLIHGAAGGVGSFAVQVVRALGALPFATGSSSSQDALAALGAHTCIDYTRQPVATWGGPFAALLDCVNALSKPDLELLLADGGHYVNTLPDFPSVIFDPLFNPFRRIKRKTLKLDARADDLRALLQWVREGRVRPLISQRFAFADAVAALELSKSGHARGKLVVQMA